jgi:hypothetical protein
MIQQITVDITYDDVTRTFMDIVDGKEEDVIWVFQDQFGKDVEVRFIRTPDEITE